MTARLVVLTGTVSIIALTAAELTSAEAEAPILAATDRARIATWRCERALGRHPTQTVWSYRKAFASRAYRVWVRELWQGRAERCGRWLQSVALSPWAAIHEVFDPYGAGDEAVRVSQCESGLSTRAANGQYLGLFQMGASERARYGHSHSALGQARAALAYWLASGRTW